MLCSLSRSVSRCLGGPDPSGKTTDPTGRVATVTDESVRVGSHGHRSVRFGWDG